MPQKLTREIITAAIAGFEAQKTSIDSQIADLRSMLNGGRTQSAVTIPETGRRKRKFSAASRRKMAAAQKARWAGIKKSSEPPQAESVKPKKKRKMSAAARKAISEASKKRWVAVKAANKAA